MTELFKTLQNSSDEELKPCPFCGSEDIQHSYGQIDGNVRGYTILCRDCGYHVEDCEDESAVEKWNRRVSE